MNGKDYQRAAMRTNDGQCKLRLWKIIQLTSNIDAGELINAEMGLSGETGEVSDIIKKWIWHGHYLDLVHLEKELGDVMWYVALMCHAIGTDMDSIMEKNVEKLKARYPDGFDPERSKNRKAGDV